MSSKPKPVQTPFKDEKTYGYQSQDANNPYVKAYMDTKTGVDPGVGRRTDLAEQQSENEWNSAFASGLPVNVRMQMRDAERRRIRSQGAAEQQQAEYAGNQMELAKRAALLPQLVQTGSSGYNSQVPQGGGGGLASSLISGGASVGGALIIA